MNDKLRNYREFDKLKWVSDKPIPKVGEKVIAAINAIGPVIVERYFVEYGFIGVIAKPTDPPKWYIKQNGKDASAHFFPSEIRELQVDDPEFYTQQLNDHTK